MKRSRSLKDIVHRSIELIEQIVEKATVEALAQGKQEGRKEGKMEAQMEIARKLLNAGEPIEHVADLTGLSIDQVNSLFIIARIEPIKPSAVNQSFQSIELVVQATSPPCV